MQHCAKLIKWRLQLGPFYLEFLSIETTAPQIQSVIGRNYFFSSSEGADESNCVFHSAVTKQTVISLSGNLVSSASDITDECDLRLVVGRGD